jgi:uncharacterized surface protein with fasciclin (FAS1) repeats
MKYVIISEKGEVNVFEKSNEVDEFLSKSNGVFYIVNMFNKHIYVEKYEVENGKIYRIDSVRL